MPNKELHKNIPASYLVLRKDNEILMLRRYNTGYQDGKYSFPAGHVDPQESFTTAIIREAKEEIGIDIKSKDLRVVHVMHRYSKHNREERVDVFLEADYWDGEISNKEPYKCDDLSWFPINNPPANIIPCIAYFLKCLQQDIFYSEFGWDDK